MLILSKIHGRKYSGKIYSYADVFEEIVDNDPNRVQFIVVEEERNVLLAEVDILSNKIAHWGKSIGLKQSDTVALMMLNRPDFISFWVGLAKIGVTTACINTNIISKPLIHCIDVSTKSSDVKIVVIDSDLKEQLINETNILISMGIRVYYWDDIKATKISNMSEERPSKTLRNTIREKDSLLYIFTSGTTGLPKAGKITHSKFKLCSLPFSVLCRLTKEDRIYNCLPLYHSAGGMLGVSASLASGAPMVLRKKFSVRNFVSDCVKYECTAMQYIGELARFLLSAPKNELECMMKLKYAFGNGMRPDVWTKFQKRFNIEHIVEFYAATEGNVALFNSTGKVGSLGFVPRCVDFLYPVKLVRVDPLQPENPLRDAANHCILCKPGEVGLMLCEVDNKRIDRRFDGYTDTASSDKKLVKNVFKEGDVFFNTGDLLYRDWVGFFYWSDRIGDTFRWKGENVSTAEVSLAISACPGVSDVTVYGVAIPHCDGRAGMAALTLINNDVDNFNFTDLVEVIKAELPSYARPLFIRIQQEIAVTSTFKHQKMDLVKQGYNLQLIEKDAVYFYNTKEGKFEKLTTELMNNINNGSIKV